MTLRQWLWFQRVHFHNTESKRRTIDEFSCHLIIASNEMKLSAHSSGKSSGKVSHGEVTLVDRLVKASTSSNCSLLWHRCFCRIHQPQTVQGTERWLTKVWWSYFSTSLVHYPGLNPCFASLADTYLLALYLPQCLFLFLAGSLIKV